MHRDSTGFPVSIRPSHLYGSVEQMDIAEVLAMIVERACLYVPVGITDLKRPKKAFSEKEQVPKEAPFNVEKSPKEALSFEKVPAAASNLVRIK